MDRRVCFCADCPTRVSVVEKKTNEQEAAPQAPAQADERPANTGPDQNDPTTKRLLAAGADYDELPGRHITLNQVVAYNMAYYRKVAGLTQDELADRLFGWTSKPWTKVAVSAAERSWDGKRIRQFDADLIFGLSQALKVPVTAFFMPPDIDGVNERYLIDPPHKGNYTDEDVEKVKHRPIEPSVCMNMYDLILFALSNAIDDEASPGMRAYSSRLVTAYALYFGDEAPPEYLEGLTERELLIERAERIRRQSDTLREILGDFGITLERIYDRMSHPSQGEQRWRPQGNQPKDHEEEPHGSEGE